jgi:sortase (surface protein transpeptidase)
MTARRVRLVAGVAALALAAGCSPAGTGRATKPLPAAASRAPATTANGVDAARGFRSTRGYQATPAPARIEIPRIGVATGLQRLGRAANGTVEVPTGPGKWTMAGWYEGGTRPGDPGSAVILGHVDSTLGPAVFYRLRELRPGDRVEVVRAGGSRIAFTVERVEQYDKRRFPTAEVYYPTLEPMLRLVTCGGAFNYATGHYTDNVIVFASLRG